MHARLRRFGRKRRGAAGPATRERDIAGTKMAASTRKREIAMTFPGRGTPKSETEPRSRFLEGAAVGTSVSSAPVVWQDGGEDGTGAMNAAAAMRDLGELLAARCDDAAAALGYLGIAGDGMAALHDMAIGGEKL